LLSVFKVIVKQDKEVWAVNHIFLQLAQLPINSLASSVLG
jgi:hypothetical protein